MSRLIGVACLYFLQLLGLIFAGYTDRIYVCTGEIYEHRCLLPFYKIVVTNGLVWGTNPDSFLAGEDDSGCRKMKDQCTEWCRTSPLLRAIKKRCHGEKKCRFKVPQHHVIELCNRTADWAMVQVGCVPESLEVKPWNDLNLILSTLPPHHDGHTPPDGNLIDSLVFPKPTEISTYRPLSNSTTNKSSNANTSSETPASQGHSNVSMYEDDNATSFGNSTSSSNTNNTGSFFPAVRGDVTSNAFTTSSMGSSNVTTAGQNSEVNTSDGSQSNTPSDNSSTADTTKDDDGSGPTSGESTTLPVDGYDSTEISRSNVTFASEYPTTISILDNDKSVRPPAEGGEEFSQDAELMPGFTSPPDGEDSGAKVIAYLEYSLTIVVSHIVGIAIGVLIGLSAVVIALTVIFYRTCCMRRRRNHSLLTSASPEIERRAESAASVATPPILQSQSLLVNENTRSSEFDTPGTFSSLSDIYPLTPPLKGSLNRATVSAESVTSKLYQQETISIPYTTRAASINSPELPQATNADWRIYSEVASPHSSTRSRLSL